MPGLETSLHIDMLNDMESSRADPNWVYGSHWGDPDEVPRLREVRDRFLLPYLTPESVCIEIGPGGGRWTRYFLGVKRLYAVDYHQELLDELARHYAQPNIVPIKNNGSDFPGIAPNSIDFVFSFGCFVHLDVPIIEAYLDSIMPVLKRGGVAVIQYSDKTKTRAQKNRQFSENRPSVMRKLVRGAGFQILEHNTTIMHHSSIIAFTKRTLAQQMKAAVRPLIPQPLVDFVRGTRAKSGTSD